MAYNDGRFDWAIWDPISGRTTLTNTVSRMTIHTAATTSSDIYGPGKGPDGSYAHFYNPSTGRIRQHQEIHHKAYATGDANGYDVGVEHQDAGPSHGVPLTAKQIDDDARLFAHLVLHYGTPNRIATVDNTHGLAWHRLGISGNFGSYDPHNRRTWSRAQTGAHWSSVQGKVCPWDERIDQIDDIYDAAQTYISGESDDTTDDEGDEDMPQFNRRTNDHTQTIPADGDWHLLAIGDEDDPTTLNLVTLPKTFDAHLFVDAQFPDDREINLRAVYADTKSGQDTKTAGQLPDVQYTTRGGTNQLAYSVSGNGSKPAAGWTRHLRFQIRGYTPGDKVEKMTVTHVDARALVWDA